MIFGTPSTSASMMAPKVDCIWVCLYSRFSTICETASRFSSTTMRMPSRSLSSRRSLIPSTRRSRANSAICSISRVLLTMKGISVMTIRSPPPRRSSISARARMTMRPRPVL